MNRSDHTGADLHPALLARLQATMPNPDGAGLNGAGESVSSKNGTGVLDNPAPAGVSPNPRLHQTTFRQSGSKPTGFNQAGSSPVGFTGGSRDRYAQARGPEPSRLAGIIQSCVDALQTNVWLIAGMAIASVLLGYVYTVKICVPLYRIQASVEVRNNKSGAHAEALSLVLTSQSLVSSVLASMPAAERASLVESPRRQLFGATDAEELLHQRLDASAIPSAQVIDISLDSPNSQAAVDFVNGLILALSKRVQEQKTASASLPDDWNNQPDRTVDQIAVIDPATPGSDPVSPNVRSNLMLAGVCGTLLGIMVALIRKFAARTFAGPGSVSEVLGVRELGAIPQRRLLAAGSPDGQPSLDMDANDESLRYLRSSLLYRPGKQPIQCLAFTSAAPGEGKTTVVANLSMSLAATGRRVLVVDGDLRRPRLHKLLQVPAGPGLSDLLRREPGGRPMPLSKFVNATSFQNLYVLPPGTPGIDAPELLAGQHLSQLFRELSKSFDFILIDTPPLLACSDARNYARAVEGVVLVVRSSETQKRAALVARDMLLQDGANIIGTVLTGWRQNYPAYNYPPSAAYAKS